MDLARSGRTVPSLAQEFEPTETTIRNCVRQAAIDAGPAVGRTDEGSGRVAGFDAGTSSPQVALWHSICGWFSIEEHLA